MLLLSIQSAPAAPPRVVAAPHTSGAVVYDVAIKNVDKSADPDAPSTVMRFVVDAGKVRIGGATAKRVYIFKDRVMYVIDNTDSSVHTLRHATVADFTAHYADVLKQLESSAGRAAPADKADADAKVANTKVALQRQQDTVTRNYHLTDVTETIDGHSCRVWEERENDIKHFEFCVVPSAALPGAAQILEGIRTLSEFREGSKFALGIDFGNGAWWSDVFRFGGVPVQIREYRYELPANEITLTAVHTGVPAAGAFDLPTAYRAEDGPDYSSWYVR